MKTVMIINEDEKFNKKIWESCNDDEITILSAQTNRQALSQIHNHKKIDLFFIPIRSKKDEKKYIACKSTDSLSTPGIDNKQLFLDDITPEELKTIIKENLY